MASAPKIGQILVPHDFEEPAEAALAYALTLAENLRARITLLHAYEVPVCGYPEKPAGMREYASRTERHAAEALEKIAREARRPNVQIDTKLECGLTWVKIVDATEKLHADLIVMGTHGRKGTPRLLLGSVAEKVIRAAPCPVLTVHETRR